MQNYTDFDYDDLPPVDLDLDLHWIQLPQAKLREREAARREAEHQRRLSEVPENHRVILGPTPLTRPSSRKSGPSSTSPSSGPSNPTRTWNAPSSPRSSAACTSTPVGAMPIPRTPNIPTYPKCSRPP